MPTTSGQDVPRGEKYGDVSACARTPVHGYRVVPGLQSDRRRQRSDTRALMPARQVLGRNYRCQDAQGTVLPDQNGLDFREDLETSLPDWKALDVA